MRPELAYERNVTLINRFSWKVLRRLKAAGARGVEIEDVRQELSIAWITASRTWKPEFSVPFGPYFMNGMKQVINRWCGREIAASQFASMSLDMTFGENEGVSLSEVVPDRSASADNTLIEKDIFEKMLSSVSNRTRLFLVLLNNPPEEIYNVFKGLQARATRARSLGYSTFIQSSIPASLIFEVMGADRTERAVIRQEVEDKSRGWSSYD